MKLLYRARVGSISALVILFMISFAGSSYGTLLFSDDFESGLDAYTGKSGGAHSGVVFGDPIDADNALAFTGVVGGGDMFTTAAFSHASGNYFLEFDYFATLAAPQDGSGFIGVSDSYPGSHIWLAGTDYGSVMPLAGDGAWNHYVISFTHATPFHIMLEDFRGPAGDAYFDNLRLHGGSIAASVPEPTTLALLAIGLLGIGARRQMVR